MRMLPVLIVATALCGPVSAEEPLPAAPAQTVTAADPILDALVPADSGNVLKQHDGGKIMVIYVTHMDTGDLVAFYRPVLEGMGWHFTSDVKLGSVRSYILGKGENGEGMLLLKPDHGVTQVLLSLTE